MSFCSSPERKTTFLPDSGLGAEVGPCQTVCGPAYLATAALASATTCASSAKAGAAPISTATAMADPDRSHVSMFNLVIEVPPLCVPHVVEMGGGTSPQIFIVQAYPAARSHDKLRRKHDLLRRSVRHCDATEKQIGGLPQAESSSHQLSSLNGLPPARRHEKEQYPGVRGIYRQSALHFHSR